MKASTIKVLVVYWALLAFGMALYTCVRSEALDVLAPVWVGAIAGTVLGQLLALRRIRVWVAIWLVLAVGLLWISQLPETISERTVWMAYVPAAMCGFWCLGDRTSLVAFWFPAVLWMLTILDGTDANAMPQTGGLVLLGGLAVMFLVFLRVREERRIALWRTVSPSPLATVAAPVTLHDGAGARLPRIAWAVIVSALGFAATMWLAPLLWQTEAFDGGAVAIDIGDPAIGLPCCPRHATASTTRARTREYLDLGRSHEHVGAPVIETGCRVCLAGGVVVGANEPITGPGPDPGSYEPAPVEPGPLPYEGGSYAVQAGAVTPSIVTPADPVHHAAHHAYEPPAGGQAAAPIVPAPPVPADIPHVPPPDVQPPPLQPQQAPGIIVPAVPPPPHAIVPPHPSARPEVAPGAPPTLRAPAPATSLVLRWAAILMASLLMIQLVALVLRPVRRAIALRHFARPFWDETVAQRVSNAWHLVLVGLRDAGWRTGADESPAVFARRVHVDGLERCATILERARHGIGIDRDDLAEMTASAEAAYRAARAQATPAARAVSWMRWPLV